MTVKGMTKKQLITLLEGKILDDNICISEGDMCYMFDNYADIYDAECTYGDITYIMKQENPYWRELRPFIQRKGNRLKGIKL